MVDPGDTAPGFTLTGARGDDIREFTLSTFADGRPVVLCFYIYDYSPVCTTQMCEVNDMEMLTFNDDAGVLGISTDGPYSHREFIADNDLTYPLLTDADMAVHEAYGMVDYDDDGRREARRGIVLVDGDRTVRYTWWAADNWDPWRVDPLTDVNDLIGDLTT